MLQRSVTLIRRFVCTRPKVSMSGSGMFRTRMHPFGRAVGPVFFLPDGDDLFQAVDQVLTRLEGLLAMRRADSDGDADVPQFQPAEAMHDRRIHHRPLLTRLADQFL